MVVLKHTTPVARLGEFDLNDRFTGPEHCNITRLPRLGRISLHSQPSLDDAST